MERHRRDGDVRAAEDALRRYAEWAEVERGLVRFVDETRSFRGLPESAAGGVRRLERAERAFLALAGAHLVEARPTHGRFVGGSAGVRLMLPGGIRAEVGGTGGAFVPGADQPASIDVGPLTVTDRRVVLAGGWERREWRFDRLVAVHHDRDAPWTALPVSGGGPVSGFLYPPAAAPLVRFRLMLALAVSGGGVAELRDTLCAALEEHTRQRPPFPLSVGRPSQKGF